MDLLVQVRDRGKDEGEEQRGSTYPGQQRPERLSFAIGYPRAHVAGVCVSLGCGASAIPIPAHDPDRAPVSSKDLEEEQEGIDRGTGAVYQWAMIGPAKIYFIIFGLLTIVGGVVGYVKAGSTASIVAGSISGIALIGAAFLLTNNVAPGLIIAGVISIALAGRFIPAFMKTGGVMPAGLMSILSVIGVIMAIVAWIKR